MNTFWRLLKMPWLATVHAWQGFLFAFVWFMVAINIAKAMPLADAAQFGVAVLITGLVVVWKMVANTLWLARDARSLGLPGVGHDADLGLLVFALASVVLPALILSAVFGHIALWLVSLALVALATLAFCLLPLVIALPAFLIPTVLASFGFWQPPLPGDPLYLAWAVPALIVLTVATAQRWIALRNSTCWTTSALWRPLATGGRVVQLRRLRGVETAGDSLTGAGKRFCRTLHRVGPRHPIRSLRTVIGQDRKPLDLVAAPYRNLGLQLLIIVLVLCMPAFAWWARLHYGMNTILQQSGMLLIWMAIATAFLQVGVLKGSLAARWSKPNAGLAMLALLPHVSPPARIRRDTVIACAARALWVKAAFALGFALALAVLGMPLMFYVYLTLMYLCGTCLELALATNVVGGMQFGTRTTFALSWSTLIPTVLTEMCVRTHGTTHIHLATLGWPAVLCVVVWFVWAAGFAWLALRGWRAMRRRPHPFLPGPAA